MDKRFEEVNKRFESVDKKFEEMREDMDKRFKEMREDMDKRFEEMREDMNKRFEEVNKRFELMDKRISRLEVDVGTLKGLVKKEWYRGRAYAVFGSVLYKGKNYIEIADKLLIKAVEEGKITEEEREKVLSTDMLWYGERKEKEFWLLRYL